MTMLLKMLTNNSKGGDYMTEEEYRSIMHAVANMSEDNKVAFICQMFGLFEIAVDQNENISPEQFYDFAEEYLSERG